MKKRIRFPRFFCLAVLALGLLSSLLFSACAGSRKEPVLPPARTEGRMYVDFAGDVITEAVNESDAIAYVRIGDWLGDAFDDMNTMFEAEIIETIRGELPKKITLLQHGVSTATLPSYPLFTAGNELLLFLNKAQHFETPADAYFIKGSYFTVCDIVSVDGEKYVLPRTKLLVDALAPKLYGSALEYSLRERALEELKRSDDIWNELPRESSHIFSLDKLALALKGN